MDFPHRPCFPMLQPWHKDGADLVSLLCLKTAKSGGLRCTFKLCIEYALVLW
jgi:hypothetical protein